MIGKTPLVSVVIPAYNASPWITKTIKSVLAQDCTEFEVIVVDDGSTDDTVHMAAAFGPFVRVIQKPNGGTASARNKGILSAKGRYVAFLDADDLWTPDKLPLQIALIEKTGLKWVYCDGFSFENHTGNVLSRFGKVSKLHKGDILGRLFLENFIPSGAPIVARPVFEELGYFDETILNEDWEMWLRIAEFYPVDFVNKPLFFHRVHEFSKTRDDNMMKVLEDEQRIIHLLAEKEAPRLARYKNQSLAARCSAAGRALARAGNRSEARRLFLHSIALYPYTPATFLYFIGCFASQPFVNTAVRFRRLTRRLCIGFPSVIK
jgi:glycosyltransferase involved in cell wall biosynthesis